MVMINVSSCPKARTGKHNANANQQVFDGMYKDVEARGNDDHSGGAKISNGLENTRLPEYFGAAVRRGSDEVERITPAKGPLSITSRTDPNVGVEDPSSPRTGKSYAKSFCPARVTRSECEHNSAGKQLLEIVFPGNPIQIRR
jgi:hypothetical protein